MNEIYFFTIAWYIFTVSMLLSENGSLPYNIGFIFSISIGIFMIVHGIVHGIILYYKDKHTKKERFVH